MNLDVDGRENGNRYAIDLSAANVNRDVPFTDKNRPLLLTADRILSPRCIPSPTMFVRLAALAVLRAI